MAIKILMPALSPTMTEGQMSKWLKCEGDRVKPGEVLAEIETDKATMEVESVDAGILAKIIVQNNTNGVKVNSVIAVLQEDGDEPEMLAEYIRDALAGNGDAVVHVPPAALPSEPTITLPERVSSISTDRRVVASPLAKRIAKRDGIDLRSIQGTGPHGRIVKTDLSGIEPAFIISSSQIVPHTPMRRAIASKLSISKQQIPHFYLTVSCRVDEMLEIRQKINSTRCDNKISINDFIIKASAHALKQFPNANSYWHEEHIILQQSVDIAVAVGLEDGLITPIIFSADIKGLADISTEMKQLAISAKMEKLHPSQFHGGSFTISNLGMYGIQQFSAIINPPQSCILAVGSVESGVVVKNETMHIAKLMNLTLSCDHRVIDGALAANFLGRIKSFIESPLEMLI